MIVKFAEVTNQFNWGKFMIARFTDDEWRVKSKLDGFPLLSARGWTSRHIWVCDVQMGEGAFFAPPGSAKADLDKHAIWVCPMFPLFLGWLYEHPEQYIAIMTIPRPHRTVTRRDREILCALRVSSSGTGCQGAGRQSRRDENYEPPRGEA